MKKVWITIILTLLILTLGAGAWWLYNNKTAPTDTSANTSAVTPGTTSDVRLYMIAYGDAGATGEKIGCDDSAVEVSHTVTNEDILTGTYQDLLSFKDEMYGESGLYNPLSKAEMEVVATSIDTAGVVTVVLSGALNQSGECDAPRLQVQLEKPARQFPGVNGVNVVLNGKPLAEALSLK